MAGLLAFGVAYLIARKLVKSAEYKTPKGKYKNRYK